MLILYLPYRCSTYICCYKITKLQKSCHKQNIVPLSFQSIPHSFFRDHEHDDDPNEVAEETYSYLVTLHLIENTSVMLFSKIYFYQYVLFYHSQFHRLTLNFFFLLPSILFNFLAILVFKFYQKKIELWSFLPRKSEDIFTNLQAFK